eukprot:gene20668-27458_t
MSLSSLPIWRDDTLVFVRERSAGAYGTASYFTSVVLFDFLPLRVLPPLFFTITTYWMVGFNRMAGRWLQNLLVLVLTSMCATAMNMRTSATSAFCTATVLRYSAAAMNMCTSATRHSVLRTVLVLTNMCAAAMNMSIGAAFPSVALANMAGSLLVLMNAIYAFEAIVIAEFHGAEGFRFTAFHEPGVPDDQVPHIDVNGDQVLQTFGFAITEHAYWYNVCMLLVFTVFYLTSTYILLRCQGR